MDITCLFRQVPWITMFFLDVNHGSTIAFFEVPRRNM